MENNFKVDPNMRKYNYMLENNKDYMNYTALTFGDRKISYEELHDSIDKYAKMLYNKGIRQGDIIGVCALNTPESVYLLYALDKIGAIVVGFSPFDNKEKVKKDIEITKPKMIITVDYSYSYFKDFEKALNFSTILYSPLESLNDRKLKFGYKLMQIKNGNFKLSKNDYLKTLLTKTPESLTYEEAKFIENELTDIMFTGGSTGVHKGVDLSGAGLNHVIEGMRYIYNPDFFTGKTYLGNVPFGHMVYGRSILHIALTNNMTYALTLKAMPEDFYEELVRTQAHCAVGGPPHWGNLVEVKDGQYSIRSDLKPGSLTNLQLATSGGEAKKKQLDVAVNKALKYCGSETKLGDGLGATECWSVLTLNSGNYYVEDTIGAPISTLDFKLVDEFTGKEVEMGQRGLLNVSGPSVMLGYHNNEEETNKVITYDENGKKWCNLGDFLVKNDEHNYSYVGRQKRIFVCDCDNIYPEQLENKLSALPEIQEIIVTSIPDDVRQNVPIYHVVLSDENINIKNLESKINKIVKNELGEAWLPYEIVYYDEPFIRMNNSKIDIMHYDKEYKERAKNKEMILKK